MTHRTTLASFDGLDELDAILAESESMLKAPCGPSIEPSAWVARLVEDHDAGLTDEALGELATEAPSGCSVATIRGLCEGLARRHADDSSTVAALMAIAHYHLPNLMDRR